MKFRQEQKNVRVGADTHARADTGVCPYIIAVLIFSLLLFFPPRAHAQSLQDKQTGFAARQEVCGNTKSSQGHPVADQNEEGTVKLNVVIPGITDQCGWVLDVTGDRNGNMLDYVVSAYTFLIAAAAFLALIMVMYGGFMWVFAGGNSSVIGKAKETITSAIIGLVLALLSVTILQQINPKLVDIELPGIDAVPKVVTDLGKNTCTEGTKYIAFFPKGSVVATYIDKQIAAEASGVPSSDTTLYTTGGELFSVPWPAHGGSVGPLTFSTLYAFQALEKTIPSETSLTSFIVEKVDESGYLYPFKGHSQADAIQKELGKQNYQMCGVVFYKLDDEGEQLQKLKIDQSALFVSSLCNGLTCPNDSGATSPLQLATCIQKSPSGANACWSLSGACEDLKGDGCSSMDTTIAKSGFQYQGVACMQKFNGNDGLKAKWDDQCILVQSVSCPEGSSAVTTNVADFENKANDCVEWDDKKEEWKVKKELRLSFQAKGYISESLSTNEKGVGLCCQKVKNSELAVTRNKDISSVDFFPFYGATDGAFINAVGFNLLGNTCTEVSACTGVDVKNGETFQGTCKQTLVSAKMNSHTLKHESYPLCTSTDYTLCYIKAQFSNRNESPSQIFGTTMKYMKVNFEKRIFMGTDDGFKECTKAGALGNCVPVYLKNNAQCEEDKLAQQTSGTNPLTNVQFKTDPAQGFTINEALQTAASELVATGKFVDVNTAESFLESLAIVESNANPNAKSGNDACGIMQMKPDTAKELIEKRSDIRQPNDETFADKNKLCAWLQANPATSILLASDLVEGMIKDINQVCPATVSWRDPVECCYKDKKTCKQPGHSLTLPTKSPCTDIMANGDIKKKMMYLYATYNAGGYGVANCDNRTSFTKNPSVIPTMGDEKFCEDYNPNNPNGSAWECDSTSGFLQTRQGAGRLLDCYEQFKANGARPMNTGPKDLSGCCLFGNTVCKIK